MDSLLWFSEATGPVSVMYAGIDRTFAALAVAEQVAHWMREDEGGWRDHEWRVVLNRFDIVLWRLGIAGAQQCFFAPPRPSFATSVDAFAPLMRFVADCSLESPSQECKAMCSHWEVDGDDITQWPITLQCIQDGCCALGIAACVESFLVAEQTSDWFVTARLGGGDSR
ncbi:MAG: hypothetical protein ACYC90_00385 [Candidatus Nanopelagicales bacterium]